MKTIAAVMLIGLLCNPLTAQSLKEPIEQARKKQHQAEAQADATQKQAEQQQAEAAKRSQEDAEALLKAGQATRKQTGMRSNPGDRAPRVVNPEVGSALNLNDVPNDCAINVGNFPSELRYYANFHPSDSVFDFFCKAQMIPSSGSFKVFIGGSVTHSEFFTFDGTPRRTKRDLAVLLVRLIQGYVANASRGRSGASGGVAREMSALGIPAASPEGRKAFLNRDIKLSFTGIKIMDVDFELSGFFEANVGVMTKWLKGTEHPFPVLNGGDKVVIALPFAMNAMSLYSAEHNLSGNGAGRKAIKESDSLKGKIKAGMSGKYASFKAPGKFVSSIEYAEGVHYTDKAISILVEELTDRTMRYEDGRNYTTKWFRVAYLPAKGGVFAPARDADEFDALVKARKGKYGSQPTQEKVAPLPF